MPPSVAGRLRWPTVRLTRRRIIAGSVVTVLLGALLVWVLWPAGGTFRSSEHRISVRTGPDDTATVDLDATFYLPEGASAQSPVPAVLLAHGFGGTKRSVTFDAEELAGQGYAVLTWTAQGFGRSTGEIHLNNPDWEVKDAQRLIDWLADRPEIDRQSSDDPKVAAVGASYGGALALMLAAADSRVDAIVPMITWNDLARAFLPEATGGQPEQGVYKRAWAGLFFAPASSGPGAAAAALSGTGPAGGGDADVVSPGGATTPQLPDPRCGRFAQPICEAYLQVTTTGRATPETVALLQRSSPAGVIDRIAAPTLLVQGTADSLFPLSEADANARGIAANGTPVRVAWFTGGHDGGAGPQSDTDRVKYLTAQWLDHYLADRGKAPAGSFTYSRVAGLNAADRGVVTSAYSTGGYPGLVGDSTLTVPVAGPPQAIANPPSGTPAPISALPLTGGLAGLAGLLGGAGLGGDNDEGFDTEIAGQHADFVSAPLERTTDVVGSPTVRLKAASPTGEAVLFVKLYDLDPQGPATLPDGLVAPVRLTGLSTSIADAAEVTVTLPAIVHRFEAGHRLRVTIATADQAYATPAEPMVLTVDGTGQVQVPVVEGTAVVGTAALWWTLVAVLVGLILVAVVISVVVAGWRRRRRTHEVDPEHAQTPLVVRGLRKEYADGFVAVEKVDFTVRRDTVVGMLGPNGAGKTTTLRVLMGLTRPTQGEVLVYGQRLYPGAPVLTRVGALVEGPGFLPHLSGHRNLQLYWKATGRPTAEANFERAYEIAGLGGAVHRRVKTYSHGMKQRLAIAQAMLGLPELLVLDEPTDGLDPPQIAAMREVLRDYATDGRSVLVSSHLLAEVEQVCTEVVVMHKGLVVAAGPVSEIVGDSPTVQVDIEDAADAEQAQEVLGKVAGVRSVTRSGATGLIVDMNGAPRAEAIAALVGAGVGVDRVVPRRRLEDAFLSLVGGDTTASGER